MKGKKTGGRKQGSTNLMTRTQTQQVAQFLERYDRGELKDGDGNMIDMESDFGKMSPTDRVIVAVRLRSLITPKPIDVGLTTEATLTIEDRLVKLAQENDVEE